jgi:hypothetical protein
MEASEVPPLKGCPKREITSSRSADAPVAPPAEPAKKEAVKEEKKEEKKEAKALVQKKGSDDMWTPPCDWHLNEDGTECISKQQKCSEQSSEKPILKNCPHRYTPYEVNKDGSPHTPDRATNPPPAPPAEPAKKEEAKGE